MTTPLIHGGMLAGLRNFYPQTVTIQQNTPALDTDGAELPVWANLSGHVDLSCRVAPQSLGSPARQEVRGAEMTVTTVQLWITLRGYYPAITPDMRAVVSGVNYNILAADRDAAGVTTRLGVERVSI
ncbi:MAG: head-tail adaptor protein [Chloroflexi bacterium]|nr:head-tail adaptor protein [Chloroflexota bacterium]